MKKIYIIGGLNFNINLYVNKFPTRNDNARALDSKTNPGGKAHNQAITAKRYLSDVRLLGSVGNDIYGDMIIDSLSSNGIDTNFVKKIDGVSTGTAYIMKHNKDKEIVKTIGTNNYIYEEDIDPFLSDSNEGDILILHLELDMAVTKYALKLANEKKLLVILNPSPVNDEAINLLSSCDYVILNETELSEITGVINIEKATKYLKSLNTIVTLGENGVYFPDENVKFDALCKDMVVDTTGAGDVFIGAFASMIAKDKRPIEALDFARGAASLSCTKEGVIESIPDINDVLKLIEREDLIS